MSVSQDNLNVNDSVELLSYIINVTPALRENIYLPVQRTKYIANWKINNWQSII